MGASCGTCATKLGATCSQGMPQDEEDSTERVGLMPYSSSAMHVSAKPVAIDDEEDSSVSTPASNGRSIFTCIFGSRTMLSVTLLPYGIIDNKSHLESESEERRPVHLETAESSDIRLSLKPCADGSEENDTDSHIDITDDETRLLADTGTGIMAQVAEEHVDDSHGKQDSEGSGSVARVESVEKREHVIEEKPLAGPLTLDGIGTEETIEEMHMDKEEIIEAETDSSPKPKRAPRVRVSVSGEPKSGYDSGPEDLVKLTPVKIKMNSNWTLAELQPFVRGVLGMKDYQWLQVSIRFDPLRFAKLQWFKQRMEEAAATQSTLVDKIDMKSVGETLSISEMATLIVKDIKRESDSGDDESVSGKRESPKERMSDRKESDDCEDSDVRLAKMCPTAGVSQLPMADACSAGDKQQFISLFVEVQVLVSETVASESGVAFDASELSDAVATIGERFLTKWRIVELEYISPRKTTIGQLKDYLIALMKSRCQFPVTSSNDDLTLRWQRLTEMLSTLKRSHIELSRSRVPLMNNGATVADCRLRKYQRLRMRIADGFLKKNEASIAAAVALRVTPMLGVRSPECKKEDEGKADGSTVDDSKSGSQPPLPLDLELLLPSAVWLIAEHSRVREYYLPKTPPSFFDVFIGSEIQILVEILMTGRIYELNAGPMDFLFEFKEKIIAKEKISSEPEHVKLSLVPTSFMNQSMSSLRSGEPLARWMDTVPLTDSSKSLREYGIGHNSVIRVTLTNATGRLSFGGLRKVILPTAATVTEPKSVPMQIGHRSSRAADCKPPLKQATDQSPSTGKESESGEDVVYFDF